MNIKASVTCDSINGPRYVLSKSKYGQEGVKKVCDPENLKELNRKFYLNGKYIYCSPNTKVELLADGNWFRCLNHEQKVDRDFFIYFDKKDRYFSLSSRFLLYNLEQYLCVGQAANSTQYIVGKPSEVKAFTCKAS